MRINEVILTELFDRPVPWKWTYQAADQYEASFSLNNVDYAVHIIETGRQYWEVTFRDKDRADPYGITGKQKQQSMLIFSTVIDILKQFKQANPGVTFTFSAEEPNRQKLYNRIVSSMKKLGYDVGIDDWGDESLYYVR